MNNMELLAPSSVKDIANILVDTSKYLHDYFGNDWQKVATKYNFALNEYFNAKLQSLSKVKPTFATEVVSLDSVYVAQFLEFKDEPYHQDYFLDKIKEDKRFIISATAGAGKSCLLKNYFIDIIRYRKLFFPIFLELRKTNEKSTSILETLTSDIAQYNDKFNQDNLGYILKREDTILFLDGFDEINFDKKSQYIKELNHLSNIYPNLMIMVSSRPEYRFFEEWTLYNVASINPLNLQQATELVKKVNYDKEVKDRFIQSLYSGLYNTQFHFARNPLLLTIMLFTYGQYGDIPNKLHIFYDLAYTTLFNRHDNSKQGYHRKSLTNLDIYEFRNVFSLCCVASYSRQSFVFMEKTLEKWIESALKLYQFNDIATSDYKKELLVNIPLIMQDGLEFSFTHRSFQEYFTAFYLVNNPDKSEALFNEVCKRFYTDDVVNIAFALNPQVIEDKWILPNINQILSEVKEIDTVEGGINNIRLFFSQIRYHSAPERYIGYILSKNAYFTNFLINLYCLEKEQTEYIDSHFTEEALTYEEIDLVELVLEDKRVISLDELSQFEKDLIHRAKSYEVASTPIAMLTLIKKRILHNRQQAESAIEDLIFS